LALRVSLVAAGISMTRMVAGTNGSGATRMGSMDRNKSSTTIAGIDVGKRQLDAAVLGRP
jgi:hypothetical protein